MNLPTYIPKSDKLPWLDAVCVVLPQLPYLMNSCVKKEYRNRNLLSGFCYTASEAIYHLSADAMKPYSLRFGSKPHQTHWFLRLLEEEDGTAGKIVDVTASQFPDSDFFTMYGQARGRGFMTKGPSKRARLVLDRIDRNVYFRRQRGVKDMWVPYGLPIKVKT